MLPYSVLEATGSSVAPAPVGAAPGAIFTSQAVPWQSVMLKLAAPLVDWASICSITVCASIVAVVSLLLLVLVYIAVVNKMVSAPNPTASTTIAIIISMRLKPRCLLPFRACDCVIFISSSQNHSLAQKLGPCRCIANAECVPPASPLPLQCCPKSATESK